MKKNLLDLVYEDAIAPAYNEAVMVKYQEDLDKKLEELRRLESSPFTKFISREVNIVGAFDNECLIPYWDKERKTVFLGKWHRHSGKGLYVRFAPKSPYFIALANNGSPFPFRSWFYLHGNPTDADGMLHLHHKVQGYDRLAFLELVRATPIIQEFNATLRSYEGNFNVPPWPP